MGQTGGAAMITSLAKRCLATAALLAVGFGGSYAQDGDAGYAGSWLQVDIGARPTALGGAYRAVSDDGIGGLFNPAGLTTIPQVTFASSYRVMQLDRQLLFASVLFPAAGDAVIGAQWLYAGSGDVEARDSDGALLGRSIYQANNQFSVVFGKRFETWFGAGVTISYLYSVMPEINASSVGFDFGGMLYIEQLIDREVRDRWPVRQLQVGLVVKNIAKSYRWNSEEYVFRYTTSGLGREQTDDFPIEVGLGVSGRWLDEQLLTTIDVVQDAELDPRLHAGAEYALTPEVFLRGGFANGRLTAGTGFIFRLGGRLVALDYAFSTDRADEGSEHIFSFDFLL